jgi:hypothetical protein
MAKAWVLVLVSAFAVAFLAGAGFAAAEPPVVTILPGNQIVSVNSDVVIKVDPKTSGRPIRITWSVFDTGNEGVGSIPFDGTSALCYFSNTDGNATCGPSPFEKSGETEFDVYVVTPSAVTNVTIPMNVSPVNIDVSGIVREDNTVYMTLYMPQLGQMKYSIYKSDVTIYQSERPLDYDGPHARYVGNITLNPGVYYFTFVGINGSSAYGSALKRIEIPSSDFLNMQTDKSDYWKGGRITITGSSSNNVVGEIRYPNGNKAADFTANVSGDHSFSYDFYSQSDWPEGTYVIRTSQPLIKTANFTITEFFELNPKSISSTVNKSSDFSASLSLKNVRQNSTNVSFTTSGGMKDSYVSIANRTLAPQQTTAITVSIPDVESSIDGKITLKTSEGLELAVPVKVTVAESGECPSCPPPSSVANALETDAGSLVWSQECLADEEIARTVTLNNKGETELTGFDYSITDSGDQSLETLDTMGKLEIPVKDLSIGAGKSGDVEIKLTPSAAGRYEGIIEFKSGGNAAPLFVSLTCFENISGALASISARLTKASPPDAVKTGIASDLDTAENALSMGSFARANEFSLIAQAKMDAVESSGTSKPVDLTWILIILVIAAVVFILIWILKSRKPKIAGTEEVADELGNFS